MILCAGEALIDMIPVPTTDGKTGFVPHPGGAVFNTAIALGRQGVRVGMLTGLSTDLFGQQLSEALKASHVATDHVIRSDQPSTLAFIHLVAGHATYDFFDENSAGRMLSPDDMPSLPQEIEALFFGGISLACDPCADAYARLLQEEGARRAVMMDPNIRPSFIADVSRYRTRLDQMMAQADIVKLSDEDLDWVLPDPRAQEDKVARLLEKGPSILILTRGKEGATGFLASGQRVDISARRADVVDTVGAGDTFNAGVLAKLSQLGCLKKPQLAQLSPAVLEQALQHGADVAAITVSRAGANPPWADEL